MTNSPNTYNELKAHYLAVKKRLGGLGPSAGLVPPSVVHKPIPVKQVVVEAVEEQIDEVSAPAIKWSVKGMPKNNFWRILMEVAEKHNVDPNLIIEPNRKKAMVAIRREVVWRAVYEAKYSRARVGRMLKRDHTTILHDLNCWERDHGARA